MEVFEVLDVRELSKRHDYQQVRMLTPQERRVYRVHIHDGLFKKNGALFDTKTMYSHGKVGFASFVLNLDGELSVFTHRGGERGDDNLRHSSINAGLPVIAAGEIKIENGILSALTSHSGHYYPSLFNIYRLLEHFSKHSVDISHAKVITFDDPSTVFPNISVQVVSSPLDKQALYSTHATEIYTVEDTHLKMRNELERCVTGMNDRVTCYINKNSVSSYNKLNFPESLSCLLKHLVWPSATNVQDQNDIPTLGKERALLAVEFENQLTQFKSRLTQTELLTLYEFTWKIQELKVLIATYETKNFELSVKYKGEGSEGEGRLANAIGIFKRQAKNILKTMELEDKTILHKMKFIDV
jgi:hypothetical protein